MDDIFEHKDSSMRKILFVSTFLVASLASLANPSLARTTAEQPNTLSVGFGPERSAVDTSDSYKGAIVWIRSIGSGFSLGAQAESFQIQGGRGRNEVRTSFEGNVGYRQPLTDSFSVRLGAGVGERIQARGNFGYYALYARTDYQLIPQVTLNLGQYRYRNAFDTTNRFETHQVGAGVTWHMDTSKSVGLRIYRTYNSGWERQSDGGALVYSVRF